MFCPEIKIQGTPSCQAESTPVIVLVEAQPVETKAAPIPPLLSANPIAANAHDCSSVHTVYLAAGRLRRAAQHL